jgi:hypothetical protein
MLWRARELGDQAHEQLDNVTDRVFARNILLRYTGINWSRNSR